MPLLQLERPALLKAKLYRETLFFLPNVRPPGTHPAKAYLFLLEEIASLRRSMYQPPSCVQITQKPCSQSTSVAVGEVSTLPVFGDPTFPYNENTQVPLVQNTGIAMEVARMVTVMQSAFSCCVWSECLGPIGPEQTCYSWRSLHHWEETRNQRFFSSRLLSDTSGPMATEYPLQCEGLAPHL